MTRFALNGRLDGHWWTPNQFPCCNLRWVEDFVLELVLVESVAFGELVEKFRYPLLRQSGAHFVCRGPLFKEMNVNCVVAINGSSVIASGP